MTISKMNDPFEHKDYTYYEKPVKKIEDDDYELHLTKKELEELKKIMSALYKHRIRSSKVYKKRGLKKVPKKPFIKLVEQE